MMNAARRIRTTKSPFRYRFDSHDDEPRAPSRPRRRSHSPFPAMRRRTKSEELGLHESEIHVFQQLCLDRHDENAAIEILLEDSENKNPEHPGLLDAASPSKPKKKFLGRLFGSSPRTKARSLPGSPGTPTASLQSSSERSGSENNEQRHYVVPPPSAIRRNRSSKDLSATVKMSNRVLSERIDTFSNMSSLSGAASSSRRLRTPQKLDRHESLGMDSVRDVRKTLKEMERQLGRASDNGERISRRKVMGALFTVADSLEDQRERNKIRKELSDLMKAEQRSSVSGGGFLSSVGRMFAVSKEDKKAVERALDDLLWTEFVAGRRDREKDDEPPPPRHRNPPPPVSSRAREERPLHKITVREPPPPPPRIPRDPPPSREPPRSRSLWPRAMVRGSDSGGDSGPSDDESESSSDDDESFESLWERGVSDAMEEEEESTDSGHSPGYLPRSIAVRHNTQPPAHGRASSGLEGASSSRYRVRMVDTESRLGFEMG